MTPYRTQLQALQAAMLQQDALPMLALVKPARAEALSPATRIAVYTEGYTERLVEATLSDYPALAHYMGADDCRQAVTAFVKLTPSRFWDLNLYPVGLADFLEGYATTRAAKNLARLESAITDVFWQPETAALLPEALASLNEEKLGQKRFRLRPAARLLRLEYAANDYLTQFRAEGNPPTMRAGMEWLLLVRYRDEVHRLPLEEDEHTLLAALHEYVTFNEALARIADQQRLATALSGYLTNWLKYGVFQG